MSDFPVVVDYGLRVMCAPDETLISLEVIWKNDGRGLVVSGDKVILGTAPWDVTYRIVGWDEASMALRVLKIREGVIGGGE